MSAGPAADIPAAPAPVPYEDGGLAPLLDEALARVRAPDVVVAVSRGGHRTVVSGGTAAAPAVPREDLGFGLGSLSKTFTVLLLADLARAGAVGLDDPLAAHLPGLPPLSGDACRITLRHLATHTSGLPRVPRDLFAGAVLHPYTNGYAGYSGDRLLSAYAHVRPRHAPGTRWHYSNFGLALLGSALAHTAGTAFPDLLTRRVLCPLALTATTAGADAARSRPDRAIATGHHGDGRTPFPFTDMAAFTPAGGVLSTPHDMLGYAEAHLRSAGGPLAGALRDVQVPQLRKGFGRRRETHTLTWFQHPASGGPVLFHAGATFGIQCFLGFHPATRTAVAVCATRHDRTSSVVHAAYTLLQSLAGRPLPGPAHR
ncbi:serine hydrolase domain-containing protein [Streptomyces sp. NBC_01477]|uniref:serine hydrolase domain-containing protein n=1 Tax=Streptomyces sp. NBC_01477 TaxID=2976015 RepID=UPI002E324B24|nr:serine hydrolase domain-containing protein [Streptomyces sp. NBC_01477]